MIPTTPAAWADEAWKAPARIRKAIALAKGEGHPPTGATPHEEVGRWGRVRLLYYTPVHAPTAAPVVVVPSIINRGYVLDLTPGNSLVESLVAAGVPVYMIDWGTPTPADRHADLAQHVLGWIHAAVRRATRHAGAPRAHLLGYCIGGTMAAIYAALRPARVAGLIALTAPVDFTDDGTLTRWSHEPAFPLEALVREMGLIDSEWLQGSFQLLKPMAEGQKWRATAEKLYDERYLARFLPMQRWVSDNVDVPGAFYRDLIQDLYRENRLAEGTLVLRGERVDLGAIEAPVLVALAAKDHIVPGHSGRNLAELVGSDDTTVEVFPGGHIGVVVGRASVQGLRPALIDWLQARHYPQEKLA